MGSSADKEKALAIAGRIAPQFFAEGHKRVHVAYCCDRVLVHPTETTKCRTCGNPPKGFWVTPDTLHSTVG